jgi:hypothetical protein
MKDFIYLQDKNDLITQGFELKNTLDNGQELYENERMKMMAVYSTIYKKVIYFWSIED